MANAARIMLPLMSIWAMPSWGRCPARVKVKPWPQPGFSTGVPLTAGSGISTPARAALRRSLCVAFGQCSWSTNAWSRHRLNETAAAPAKGNWCGSRQRNSARAPRAVRCLDYTQNCKGGLHSWTMTEARRRHPGIGKQWVLAVLCVCSGLAPLAARWIPVASPGSHGLLITAVFLALTLLARTETPPRRFWELSFAFFIFALVQVLNNSVAYFGIYVLRDAPVEGNPLASTVFGTVGIQLLGTLVAIVPIVALTKAAGLELGSIYARRGKVGPRFALAIVVFVAFYVMTATGHSQRAFPTNGAVTLSRVLALTPALLVVAISNGFQEEFLFRGLFLQKYNAFFGARVRTSFRLLFLP